MIEPGSAAWSPADAAELYEVARWGNGYFSVGNNGHLLVHPDRRTDRSIDLKELVDRLQLRGIDVPVLLRFNGIIRDRLKVLNDAFVSAITEYQYTGKYSCVYPIKVNQQREVVEQVVKSGREFGFGLEAGSKPELLAVVAMTEAQTPIICNGFKDAEFIEMALLAQKVGRHVIPVVEKYTELKMILHFAQKIGVRPVLGMRVKLAARGAGRWQSSGGYRSKFGLRVNEILSALDELKSRGMEDCFQLLHFHLGSQITNIRQVKSALNEASRVYADLVKRNAGLKYLDVGGGLGVDYDGSRTNFESSMNYTIEEYARDVVYHIQTVCDDADVPHPDIISESGRAVSAFHSVLIFGVLGVSQQGREEPQEDLVPPTDAPQPIHDLYQTYTDLAQRNVLESYHDAQNAIELAMTLFATGHLPLEQRCLAESLYFSICHRIWTLTSSMEYVPTELEMLDRMLSDNYFCNFSLFQSIPDSWAIKQLFPVMPIHRLDEQPKRHAVLSDITCDSDGKIDQFISRRDVKRTLLLHEFDGTPYFMGTFLIGAYQEILGDLHNLFGDTNAVHVDLSDSGEVTLDAILKGETVSEVLDYVRFNGRDLIHRLQIAVENAVRNGRIDDAQAGDFVRCYENALNGYTYLAESAVE
ncbi:MAG: biosynthetic arginine decarboxylase [Fuerstiella sp.]|nr:biosynthetic arginine decarboxylase [Fuerstiella sp.]